MNVLAYFCCMHVHIAYEETIVRMLTMYSTQWRRSESATIPSYTIDKEVQVMKCTHYVQALVSCIYQWEGRLLY